MFPRKKVSKSLVLFYLEQCLYPSMTEIVEAMITFIQEGHNHSECCITIKVSRGTQRNKIYLAFERSGFEFFSTDLGHLFGSNVGNDFRVMLRGKRALKPQFAYDIVCINSLMIYRELIEYIIVGDTKTPLLRCFSFISKLKA